MEPASSLDPLENSVQWKVKVKLEMNMVQSYSPDGSASSRSMLNCKLNSSNGGTFPTLEKNDFNFVS